MTAYQVLARRWRPQRFADLVGQDVVVRTLHNALERREIAHAFLFSGLRGVGKTTAARLLAKALNCDHGPTPEPCGECVPCRGIADGSTLDVLEMDAASNRGIDDVRELREVARVLPVRDRYRVFIIDEAHQLTEPAFNALLKILEEPPAHVIFVLASTEKDKFPATILSRCQQLDFRPIPADVISARLALIAGSDGFDLTPEAAQIVARAAEGSLRDALSLLDRVRAFSRGSVDEAAVTEVLGLPPQEVLLAAWEALAAGDAAGAIDLIRREDRQGRDPIAVYDGLVGLLDALLLLACDQGAQVPWAGAVRERLAESARSIGVPLLLRLAGLALEQRGLVVAAERPAQAVAIAVGRLALWPRLQRVEALLAGETAEAPPPGLRAAPPRPLSPEAEVAPVGGAAGPQPGQTQARLGDALAANGDQLLAGRVRAAREVAVEDDTLVLRFAGVPPATVQSVRDSAEHLAAAARRAGLPERVRVEGNGAPAEQPANELQRRVEADEAVKRVLEIFGGRIERVEEKA